MSTATSHIVRRDFPRLPVDLDGVFPGEDPVAEAYTVAFSLTLAVIEPYLIRVIRAGMASVDDPQLAADAAGFVAQEAEHHAAHRFVNRTIEDALGEEFAAAAAKELDALKAGYRSLFERRSLSANLAYAAGFEAFTTAWATTDFERAAVEPPTRAPTAWDQLWAWHGAEELEHRCVAHDVHRSVVQPRWPQCLVAAVRAQFHVHRTIRRLTTLVLAAQGARVRTPWLPPWFRWGWRRYVATLRRAYHPGDIEVPAIADAVLAMMRPRTSEAAS